MAEARTPMPPRSPARTAAVVASAVILCGAVVLFASYLLHRERPLVGTPAPRALFKATVFTLPPHQPACMSAITLPPNGGTLQFELREVPGGAHGSPPIDALLRAPGYRALAHLPGEQPEGVVELPIRPPPHYGIGSVCLINSGTSAAALAGSTEARSVSRSTLTINSKPVAGDIALTFLSNHRKSRLSRVGEVFDHASNLTDHLIPVWLIWILAISVLLTVPIGTVSLFHRALREDEVA
jgi:hypothetical protein